MTNYLKKVRLWRPFEKHLLESKSTYKLSCSNVKPKFPKRTGTSESKADFVSPATQAESHTA